MLPGPNRLKRGGGGEINTIEQMTSAKSPLRVYLQPMFSQIRRVKDGFLTVFPGAINVENRRERGGSPLRKFKQRQY